MSTNWLKRIAAATALVLAVSSLTACGDSTGTSETEGTAEGTARPPQRRSLLQSSALYTTAAWMSQDSPPTATSSA